jgi:multidrug efflux system membrane fusion protein
LARFKLSRLNNRFEHPKKRQAMSEETPKAASKPAPAKRRVWPVIAVVAGVLVIGAILFRVIASRPKPAPPARPVQVSITTARQGDMGIYVEALGAVTPLATVTVPSQVSGQLLRVDFVEGQMVRAGDLLAEIDARPL